VERGDLPPPGAQELVVRRLGGPSVVRYRTEEVIHFPQGIPGFEQLTRYLLLEEAAYPPFWSLVSLEQPEIGFTLLDPCLCIPDYRLLLPATDAAALGLLPEPLDLPVAQLPLHVQVWAIVTLAPRPAEVTANLLAPLVINTAAHLGKQVISADSRYPLAWPLLPAQAQESSA